jgi:hypothetical protein
LNRTDPSGHYICKDKANCALVKEALTNIQEAIKSGNLTKKEAAELNKVVSFYGKEGKDNGVTVTFQKAGDTVGGTSTVDGRTTVTLSLKDALSNPVNSQKGASPDTQAAADVAHEGEHGVQQQAEGMPQNKAQEKAGEVDAYTVESYVNKGLQDDSSMWSPKAGAAIWSNKKGFSASAVDDFANQSTAVWCQAGGNCE